MKPVPRALFIVLILGTLVAAPAWYFAEREKHARNFRVVKEGVLYRSGQLDLVGLERLVTEHGIKTIVSLREGTAPEDRLEETWAPQAAVNFVRIPPRQWSAADGTVPAEIGLKTFREVMDNPANHPVLIHCFAGIHRTGSYVAVYRMDHGWTNREALNEMRVLGYTTLDTDEDVHGYLQRYRPRTTGMLDVRPVSNTVSQRP